MMQIEEKEDKQKVIDKIQILIAKYPDIQCYYKTARHIEDTNQCMVTLPCKNKDKNLLILAFELG